MLHSTRDAGLYIGFSTDLRRRLSEHKNGASQSTNFRGPWNLIYYEAYADEADALGRERYLKSGGGRKFLRSDAEEVKPVLFILTAATLLAAVPSATAQAAHPPLVIDNDKDFHRYVLYRSKPEYPMNLRQRRIGGAGKFLLRLRRDGTVESVETLTSTGNAELDDTSKKALITWRFRPGPSAVKVPITFKIRGTAGWPFAR